MAFLPLLAHKIPLSTWFDVKPTLFPNIDHFAPRYAATATLVVPMAAMAMQHSVLLISPHGRPSDLLGPYRRYATVREVVFSAPLLRLMVPGSTTPHVVC